MVRFTRPVADQTVCTVHDFSRTQASAAYGLVGPGFRAGPGVRRSGRRVFLAGPSVRRRSGPAGPLAGALAAYAGHELLSQNT